MLSKEEKLLYSLSALKEVIETWDIDVEVTLTKDGNKHTINAYEEIERCVVECINNTQPYKFEDLKDGMWVWDKSYQEVCYIDSIVSKEKIYCEYLESHCSIEPYIIMPFEENRFFPVQMANVNEVYRR